MCNKVGHKTTWGAAAHILYMERTGKIREGVRKMGAYWCEECQTYHITSKVKQNCEFYKNVKNVTTKDRRFTK